MYSNPEYIKLTDSLFTQLVLESTKIVVLEFGADWCGHCQIMNPVLEDIRLKYKDEILLVKLDIDLNRSLAERFAIHSRPTFLFLRNGILLDSITNLVSTSQLRQKLEQLLNHEY